MSETKLKPCPFCGGKPVLLKHNDEDYYKVFCECCGARQWTFANRTDRDAIRNWNTRKPMDNIVVELELFGRMTDISMSVDDIQKI